MPKKDSSADFIWHAKADDIYDGNKYGNTPLKSADPTVFAKEAGTGLIMTGNGTLSLEILGGGAPIWGYQVDGGHDQHLVSQFTINEGATLSYAAKVPRVALFLGQDYSLNEVKFDITGNFIVENTAFEAMPNISQGPATTVSLRQSGSFRVINAFDYTSALSLNIYDQGYASVTANSVELVAGTYRISGIPNRGKPSLEIIAVAAPSLTDSSATMSISSHDITCTSASVSRLQAESISYTATNITVQDTASMLIACDSITVDNQTVFNVAPSTKGPASATITFTGQNGGNAPFDFTKPQYPPGLFNFLSGTNIACKFRFKGKGDKSWFQNLLATGSVTLNGSVDDRIVWAEQREGSDTYFVLFVA